MMQYFKTFHGFVVLVVCLLSSSFGCTIKATLDTTTDGTTEFLSSTSGKSWWTEEGLVKRGEHARAFVATNHDTLLQEIAQGHGEYVHAFGTILGVPSHRQAHFQRLVQGQYPALAEIPIALGDDQLNRFIDHVQQTWVLSTSTNL
jgi:hypothetical protein